MGLFMKIYMYGSIKHTAPLHYRSAPEVVIQGLHIASPLPWLIVWVRNSTIEQHTTCM